MKVQLLGAQGTRILVTTDRIDHRVREKKVIQLSGTQPEASNNPFLSGWACKPYLYIESSVLSQQNKAQVQSWLTKVPVGAENIKFGPKWIENRRFGLKQRLNESQGLSGPIRTTPEAKNRQKIDFSRKTAPGGPRRPPFHTGRRPPVWGPMIWSLVSCSGILALEDCSSNWQGDLS